MNTSERELLYFALEKFMALTGARARDMSVLSVNANDQGFDDGTIEVIFNQKTIQFQVTIKTEVRGYFPAQMLTSYYGRKRERILVSRYIAKPVKEQLKEKNINYLEASGNCFISTDDIYIYINDQPVNEIRLPAEGKLWKASGIKFLFAILNNPHLLNVPFRDIAKVAQVALGTIGLYIDELKKEGFVKDGKQNGKKFLFLENKEQLIRRWAEAYRGTLRPRLQLGTYRFAQKERAANWNDVVPKDFCWGGESGAAILTKFLRPEKFTIYTNELRQRVMEQLRLIPDENGNVEILQQFWTDAIGDKPDTAAPPLLVYADLITTIDSRNHEAAVKIKEQYLG